MKKTSARSKTKSVIDITYNIKKSLQIIGVNSGTSCDGLDVALVGFIPNRKPRIIYSKTYSYTPKIRESLLKSGDPGFTDGEYWMKLDSDLGKLMGKRISDFIAVSRRKRLTPKFIASHGHTIRHLPGSKGNSRTFQIGDPSLISAIAGLPVIADFRKSDTAAGGQGAPLSPLLHQALFRSKARRRAVVNIGGIANITVLTPTNAKAKPFAADCGPGNMAIDAAMKSLLGKRFDMDGAIAIGGIPDKRIVSTELRHKFFKSTPPKSTGREQFGHKFVEGIVKRSGDKSAEDIIATISEITVQAMADFISKFAPRTEEIYLCGGGAKNRYIVANVSKALPGLIIKTTAELGYDPDYIEAMLWAYLGYCFIRGIRVDTSRFTGAGSAYIPGKLCLP